MCNSVMEGATSAVYCQPMEKKSQIWLSLVGKHNRVHRPSDHDSVGEDRMYRIMHVLPWMPISCHEWADSTMIFMSNEIMSENYCRIASRVTEHRNHWLIISPFLLRMLHFDLALWCRHGSICGITRTRGTGIVTSYSSIVLTHTNWRKRYLE